MLLVNTATESSTFQQVDLPGVLTDLAVRMQFWNWIVYICVKIVDISSESW